MRHDSPRNVLADAFTAGHITAIADAYAEPGYTLPEGARGVAFGDWNQPRLASIMGRMGYDCAWLDEWTICYACDRAFRTKPDSAAWQMYGAFCEHDCTMICGDCLIQNPEWLMDDVMNIPCQAIEIAGMDLTKNGWHILPGAAWHPTWWVEEDNPDAIVESHVPENHDYVFVSDDSSSRERVWRLHIRERA